MDAEKKRAQEIAAQSQSDAMARIILTTETAHNLPVGQRLDIVTAEVVIGMHLFKDIASAFRDTFGGRSATMQQGLRDARKTALDELRLEAHALGADAVVGVDLDYSEISGGGKSMLFLVASGTAVTLNKAASGQESVVGSPTAQPDSYRL
ncbi:YbjQ family protein [Gemmobacter sp. 24YEA27]|uniref:YbjQ family protein n=1 Tax=Gemmobacter sp. 24YEA27 TaxID=3040672 RepID=UPI0024B35301|nr:YbjQ family protein [Gemmobacter sp. 24YEA27]